MSIKKFSMMLLSTMSLAALLSGCGSDNKEGSVVGVPKVDEATCRVCHAASIDPVSKTNILPDYLSSIHYQLPNGNLNSGAGCQGCHGGGAQHNGVGPIPFPNPLASNRCNSAECHNNKVPAGITAADFASQCGGCHATAIHNIQYKDPANYNDCLGCHAVGQSHPTPNVVKDNNSGVRAITAEFSKRSHHITGGTPTNEQCAVCHLEGTAVNGVVVVNRAYHMKDNKIYLRNADTDVAFEWSGTEHTNMDNFCFSCHDTNGATSAGIATIMTGKNFGGPFSAKNPFADTLTNGYDQVARNGVVDVKTPFTVTNASHHAVSGQRYQYRFSTIANAQAWATRTGKPMPAASEIAEGHTVDGVASPFGTGLTYDPAGPEKGGEATLYEGDKFVATYIPLGDTKNVADNSTLHCGDCHTVGQWKATGPGLSTNADGSTTSVAIGAHGSNNDYLLRNSLGTDAIHSNMTYVCFNCHKTEFEAATDTLWNSLVADGEISSTVAKPTWKAGWNALHPNVFAGQIHGYGTAHAVSAFHAQCQADSAAAVTSVPNKGFNNFSSDRLQKSFRPQNDRIYDYVPFPGATATLPAGGSNAASGNITGISCTNCHNSALRNGWGGIHGGNNTYTDGLGRTQKSYRFMPGMGNYRYAPPGGWDGKDVSDPQLVTLPGAGVGAGKPMGGCYTNGGTTQAGDLNNSGGVTYGVCNHHGTSTAAIPPGIIAITGGSRTTLGGGTSSNATASEPTVREATAGGTLVTRPLKY